MIHTAKVLPVVPGIIPVVRIAFRIAYSHSSRNCEATGLSTSLLLHERSRQQPVVADRQSVGLLCVYTCLLSKMNTTCGMLTYDCTLHIDFGTRKSSIVITLLGNLRRDEHRPFRTGCGALQEGFASRSHPSFGLVLVRYSEVILGQLSQ
jgi:hypothetical protein